MNNLPVYTIGVVSEFLGVNPETIRSWERAGLVRPPKRRSGKRFYSEYELRRLQFIRDLVKEGLTPAGIRHYLQLYPCWEIDDCPVCMSHSLNAGCAKSCWKEPGTYCQVSATDDLCSTCELRHHHSLTEATVTKQDT